MNGNPHPHTGVVKGLLTTRSDTACNEDSLTMAHDAVSALKHFEAYLASGRAPCWTMAISDLHGFLTGIAMGGAVAEEEWLPLIWSGEQPEFGC